MADQISIEEFVDPFRGEQVNISKKKGALAQAVKIGARGRKFKAWNSTGNSLLWGHHIKQVVMIYKYSCIII